MTGHDDIFLHVQAVSDSLAMFAETFKDHPSAGSFTVLNDMLSSIPALVDFAVQYDYKDVKANGVRSLIRSIDRFCKAALTIRADEVDDFLFMLKYMNRGTQMLLDGAEDVLNDNYNSKFQRSCVIEAYGFGEEVLKRTLSSRYFAINTPAFRLVLMPIFMLASFCHSLSTYDAFRSLFSFKASVENYARYVEKASASQMSKFVRMTDGVIPRIFARIMRLILDRGAMYEVHSYSETVPSAYEIVMGKTDIKLETRSLPTTSQVSFRTLKRGSSEKYKDKVLIYIHGGAFFGPKAVSMEDLYVKDWCSPCPGLTIVNVDYPYSPEHRFPEALQGLLDLYLWLISRDEAVEKLLGFHPKEIVLSGDSCGGNLAAALLLVINDLRIHGLAHISLMPRSLALFFPKLSIRLEMLPSMCLAVMDPLINLYVLLRVGQVYPPATKKDKDGVPYLTSEVPHDYVTNEDYDLFATPYTSINLYEHFESLSDVNLNIMALHFDPLLDESIRLAKHWRGPVDLQVMDDACHGGFIFRVFYPPLGTGLSDAAMTQIQKSFS